MSSDRRKHPRVPYGAWVEDETDEQGLQFYLAKNLSVGGILLTAKGSPPSIGNQVRLRLVVENESRVMSVQGKVIRHDADEDGAFAVTFVDLDAVRKAFLEDLINELAVSSRTDR